MGCSALAMAACSTVSYGEDRKRAVAVKWLLEHGANPDRELLYTTFVIEGGWAANGMKSHYQVQQSDGEVVIS